MHIETIPAMVQKTSIPTNQSWMRWLPPMLGLLVYLPTLGYGFVWDDRFAIVGNSSLRSWSTVPQMLWGKLDPTVAMYRPVTSLVQFLEYQVFGLHPWGYHLTSAVLHAVACALVFRVALALCADLRCAVLAGALFAVHAVHLEAVAWASTVGDPLVTCFILAGFLAYLRYRRQRSVLWLSAVCACLFLGLMTKETALVLPLLFAAYELICGDQDSRRLRVNLLPATSLIAIVVIYAVLRGRAYAGFVANESKLPFSTLLFTWPSLLVGYLRLLLVPYPLSPFYENDYVLAPSAAFWMPLAVLAAVGVAIYWVSRRVEGGRLVRFCAVAMVVCIIPVLDLNIFQFREVLHDRFVYVPSVFFALLVAWLLLRATQRLRAAAPVYAAVGALVLIGQACALFVQQPCWRSDFTLWSHAVQVAPRNPRASFALANEYLERGELPRAEQELERIVGLVHAPKAFFMLAQTRMLQGRFAAAEDPLRQAIALVPERPAQQLMLAQCLEQLGRRDEAIAAYRAEAAVESQFKQAAIERLSQLSPAKR